MLLVPVLLNRNFENLPALYYSTVIDMHRSDQNAPTYVYTDAALQDVLLHSSATT